MNDETIRLYLTVRDVPAGTDPLPGCVAWVDVDPHDTRTIGLSVHTMTDPPVPFDAFDGLFAADDPDREHGFEPRYEPAARPMAGVPVFATPAVTAMDERNTAVEASVPWWLSEPARRGVATIMRAIIKGEAC